MCTAISSTSRSSFVAFLWYDAIVAFRFPTEGFGIGVGTLIMLVNIILLTTYTFSCHSLRHLVGGKMDCFSCTAFGRCAHSALEVGDETKRASHVLGLGEPVFRGADRFYIRLVSSGVIRDIRLL